MVQLELKYDQVYFNGFDKSNWFTNALTDTYIKALNGSLGGFARFMYVAGVSAFDFATFGIGAKYLLHRDIEAEQDALGNWWALAEGLGFLLGTFAVGGAMKMLGTTVRLGASTVGRIVLPAEEFKRVANAYKTVQAVLNGTKTLIPVEGGGLVPTIGRVVGGTLKVGLEWGEFEATRALLGLSAVQMAKASGQLTPKDIEEIKMYLASEDVDHGLFKEFLVGDPLGVIDTILNSATTDEAYSVLSGLAESAEVALGGFAKGFGNALIFGMIRNIGGELFRALVSAPTDKLPAGLQKLQRFFSKDKALEALKESAKNDLYTASEEWGRLYKNMDVKHADLAKGFARFMTNASRFMNLKLFEKLPGFYAIAPSMANMIGYTKWFNKEAIAVALKAVGADFARNVGDFVIISALHNPEFQEAILDGRFDRLLNQRFLADTFVAPAIQSFYTSFLGLLHGYVSGVWTRRSITRVGGWLDSMSPETIREAFKSQEKLKGFIETLINKRRLTAIGRYLHKYDASKEYAILLAQLRLFNDLIKESRLNMDEETNLAIRENMKLLWYWSAIADTIKGIGKNIHLQPKEIAQLITEFSYPFLNEALSFLQRVHMDENMMAELQRDPERVLNRIEPILSYATQKYGEEGRKLEAEGESEPATYVLFKLTLSSWIAKAKSIVSEISQKTGMSPESAFHWFDTFLANIAQTLHPDFIGVANVANIIDKAGSITAKFNDVDETLEVDVNEQFRRYTVSELVALQLATHAFHTIATQIAFESQYNAVNPKKYFEKISDTEIIYDFGTNLSKFMQDKSDILASHIDALFLREDVDNIGQLIAKYLHFIKKLNESNLMVEKDGTYVPNKHVEQRIERIIDEVNREWAERKHEIGQQYRNIVKGIFEQASDVAQILAVNDYFGYIHNLERRKIDARFLYESEEEVRNHIGKDVYIFTPFGKLLKTKISNVFRIGDLPYVEYEVEYDMLVGDSPIQGKLKRVVPAVIYDPEGNPISTVYFSAESAQNALKNHLETAIPTREEHLRHIMVSNLRLMKANREMFHSVPASFVSLASILVGQEMQRGRLSMRSVLRAMARIYDELREKSPREAIESLSKLIPNLRDEDLKLLASIFKEDRRGLRDIINGDFVEALLGGKETFVNYLLEKGRSYYVSLINKIVSERERETGISLGRLEEFSEKSLIKFVQDIANKDPEAYKRIVSGVFELPYVVVSQFELDTVKNSFEKAIENIGLGSHKWLVEPISKLYFLGKRFKDAGIGFDGFMDEIVNLIVSRFKGRSFNEMVDTIKRRIRKVSDEQLRVELEGYIDGVIQDLEGLDPSIRKEALAEKISMFVTDYAQDVINGAEGLENRFRSGGTSISRVPDDILSLDEHSVRRLFSFIAIDLVPIKEIERLSVKEAVKGMVIKGGRRVAENVYDSFVSLFASQFQTIPFNPSSPPFALDTNFAIDVMRVIGRFDIVRNMIRDVAGRSFAYYIQKINEASPEELPNFRKSFVAFMENALLRIEEWLVHASKYAYNEPYYETARLVADELRMIIRDYVSTREFQKKGRLQIIEDIQKVNEHINKLFEEFPLSEIMLIEGAVMSQPHRKALIMQIGTSREDIAGAMVRYFNDLAPEMKVQLKKSFERFADSRTGVEAIANSPLSFIVYASSNRRNEVIQTVDKILSNVDPLPQIEGVTDVEAFYGLSGVDNERVYDYAGRAFEGLLRELYVGFYQMTADAGTKIVFNHIAIAFTKWLDVFLNGLRELDIDVDTVPLIKGLPLVIPDVESNATFIDFTPLLSEEGVFLDRRVDPELVVEVLNGFAEQIIHAGYDDVGRQFAEYANKALRGEEIPIIDIGTPEVVDRITGVLSDLLKSTAGKTTDIRPDTSKQSFQILPERAVRFAGKLLGNLDVDMELIAIRIGKTSSGENVYLTFTADIQTLPDVKGIEYFVRDADGNVLRDKTNLLEKRSFFRKEMLRQMLFEMYSKYSATFKADVLGRHEPRRFYFSDGELSALDRIPRAFAYTHSPVTFLYLDLEVVATSTLIHEMLHSGTFVHPDTVKLPSDKEYVILGGTQYIHEFFDAFKRNDPGIGLIDIRPSEQEGMGHLYFASIREPSDAEMEVIADTPAEAFYNSLRNRKGYFRWHLVGVKADEALKLYAGDSLGRDAILRDLGGGEEVYILGNEPLTEGVAIAVKLSHLSDDQIQLLSEAYERIKEDFVNGRIGRRDFKYKLKQILTMFTKETYLGSYEYTPFTVEIALGLVKNKDIRNYFTEIQSDAIKIVKTMRNDYVSNSYDYFDKSSYVKVGEQILRDYLAGKITFRDVSSKYKDYFEEEIGAFGYVPPVFQGSDINEPLYRVSVDLTEWRNSYFKSQLDFSEKRNSILYNVYLSQTPYVPSPFVEVAEQKLTMTRRLRRQYIDQIKEARQRFDYGQSILKLVIDSNLQHESPLKRSIEYALGLAIRQEQRAFTKHLERFMKFWDTDRIDLLRNEVYKDPAFLEQILKQLGYDHLIEEYGEMSLDDLFQLMYNEDGSINREMRKIVLNISNYAKQVFDRTVTRTLTELGFAKESPHKTIKYIKSPGFGVMKRDEVQFRDVSDLDETTWVSGYIKDIYAEMIESSDALLYRLTRAWQTMVTGLSGSAYKGNLWGNILFFYALTDGKDVSYYDPFSIFVDFRDSLKAVIDTDRKEDLIRLMAKVGSGMDKLGEYKISQILALLNDTIHEVGDVKNRFERFFVTLHTWNWKLQYFLGGLALGFEDVFRAGFSPFDILADKAKTKQMRKALKSMVFWRLNYSLADMVLRLATFGRIMRDFGHTSIIDAMNDQRVWTEYERRSIYQPDYSRYPRELMVQIAPIMPFATFKLEMLRVTTLGFMKQPRKTTGFFLMHRAFSHLTKILATALGAIALYGSNTDPIEKAVFESNLASAHEILDWLSDPFKIVLPVYIVNGIPKLNPTPEEMKRASITYLDFSNLFFFSPYDMMGSRGQSFLGKAIDAVASGGMVEIGKRMYFSWEKMKNESILAQIGYTIMNVGRGSIPLVNYMYNFARDVYHLLQPEAKTTLFFSNPRVWGTQSQILPHALTWSVPLPVTVVSRSVAPQDNLEFFQRKINEARNLYNAKIARLKEEAREHMLKGNYDKAYKIYLEIADMRKEKLLLTEYYVSAMMMYSQ